MNNEKDLKPDKGSDFGATNCSPNSFHGPKSPDGYSTQYRESEGGWCFVQKGEISQRMSKTGQHIIRVYEDGSPKI